MPQRPLGASSASRQRIVRGQKWGDLGELYTEAVGIGAHAGKVGHRGVVHDLRLADMPLPAGGCLPHRTDRAIN